MALKHLWVNFKNCSCKTYLNGETLIETIPYQAERWCVTTNRDECSDVGCKQMALEMVGTRNSEDIV